MKLPLAILAIAACACGPSGTITSGGSATGGATTGGATSTSGGTPTAASHGTSSSGSTSRAASSGGGSTSGGNSTSGGSSSTGGTTYACGSSTAAPASVTVGGVTYALTWNDEFNGATLDATKWNNAATWCCGAGTNLPKNAYLTGGCLELEADQSPDGGYETGWVDTQNNFGFTRGYIEIRARLPGGQGLWPALWMDETVSNPFAEFDILEMLGNVATTIYETNHLWQQGGAGTQVHQCTFSGPDFTAGFHAFGFQMQATQVTWYVDGVQTCQSTQGINSNPVFVMLNTAVGGPGSWPGPPDSSTVFPNYLDVDYVRVYE